MTRSHSAVVRLGPEPARLARLVELTDEGALVECAGSVRLARSVIAADQLLPGRELLVVLADAELVIVGVLQPAKRLPAAAEVDGKQVVIHAAERISFQCGGASIEMTADGRIVVRGNHVETRARRLNRIRGGAVKIN